MGAPTLALEAFRMEAIGGGPAASAAYLVCATSQSADRSHLQAAQDSLLCLQSVLDEYDAAPSTARPLTRAPPPCVASWRFATLIESTSDGEEGLAGCNKDGDGRAWMMGVRG